MIKIIFYMAIALFSSQTISKAVKFEPLSECVLSMRAHGLQYIKLTETMQLNLTFESNCKDYLHHAYFAIPFSKVYPLNSAHHPRTVIFKFAGQEFTLNYSSPKDNGNFRYVIFILKGLFLF